MSTIIPKTIVQGDSLDIPCALSPYDGDWIAKLCFLGAKVAKNFQATWSAENLNFLFALSSSDTSSISTGQYLVTLIFTKDNLRQSYVQGYVHILPDPTKPLETFWAQEVLTQCEDAIKILAKKTNQSVNISGQIFTFKNLSELVLFRNQMRVEVNNELKRLGMPSVGGKKTIQSRFRPI